MVVPTLSASELTESDFTDAELTILALAADPDEVPHDDAIPLLDCPDDVYGSLPRWYMPPPMATGRSPWRTTIILLLVASFLLIEALGLCVTYGQLVAA
jgi:hypothetical protein